MERRKGEKGIYSPAEGREKTQCDKNLKRRRVKVLDLAFKHARHQRLAPRYGAIKFGG